MREAAHIVLLDEPQPLQKRKAGDLGVEFTVYTQLVEGRRLERYLGFRPAEQIAPLGDPSPKEIMHS